MSNKSLEEINKKVEKYLRVIDESISTESADEIYKKYINLVQKIESKEYRPSRAVIANVYVSFAYFLFRVSEFEHFFKMLIQAQNYGFSSVEIDSLLFEAFIEPNINEFKKNYSANLNFLTSNGYLNAELTIPFHDLPYWLLPTEVENEYYIYLKEEKLIKEKIVLFKYNFRQSLPTKDAFSDYLILGSGDLYDILTYTNAIRKIDKKAYIVLNDLAKFLSFLQGGVMDNSIISNVVITNNIDSIWEYLKTSNAVLPRNTINLLGDSYNPKTLINEIHNYRISKGGRRGDKVLLSICIPSFNRGYRALQNVKYLLQSLYDEEIEVIISNNGTQNETKEYYEKINDIDDARLKYFAFEQNQGFAINCSKVCELASGKFILLISDEDLVDFNVLGSVMSNLYKFKESLAIMRTSSTTQSKPTVKFAQPGKDALLTFMLTSNYMSGIILNNQLLKKHKGIEYVKENLNNSVCYYYPHMFWEILLCQYGHVLGSDMVLIKEGEAEKTEVPTVGIGESELEIPYYASIEGRLEQHQGFCNIFKTLEVCTADNDLYRSMYLTLCVKTMLLTRLSINVFYKKINADIYELLERAFVFCAREEFYKNNINSDPIKYQNDLGVITRSYNQIKIQL
ncbi:glycosyltransferase [Paenibacillus sonchi]|uniref:glycosyltransferase n=1 Tax=Paenibacillus sonchi TaxID=373687 RepID=UPI001E30FF33|nr:glycosyltransferase [Paenibacillus sonchi]